MDKLEKYRQTICYFLKEQSEIIPVRGIIERETIFDRDSDRYLLLHLGWNDQQRTNNGLNRHKNFFSNSY